MNRKILVGALASTVAVGGSIGASAVSDSITSNSASKTGLEVKCDMASQNTLETNKLIGVEELKDIVLSEVNGTIEEVELEMESEAKTYFEVEVHKDEQTFVVWIDAYSGKVLKVQEPNSEQSVQAEQGLESQVNVNQSSEENVKTNAQVNSQATANVETEEKDDQHIKQPKISNETAIKIALEVASGKVAEVDLNEDENGLIYEVALKGEVDTDIKVDAETGSVLGVDINK